ncbi:MAG: methylmalonyl-CoA mutase family protein [Pseudomonadota bacterium]
MAKDILSLSSDFPDADEAQWRALVEKALKGGAPERLNSKTYDGLTVKALYRDTDAAGAGDPDGFPGEAPFIRGATATKDAYLPWDIRQTIHHPDPNVANKDILADLEAGVSSLELRIDADGDKGVVIRTAKDFAIALDGVMTDLAPVGLDTTGSSAMWGLEAAALFAAFLDTSDADLSAQPVAFNVDPIGAFARIGDAHGSIDTRIDEAAAFARDARTVFSMSKLIRVDARPVHEAGGSEAQELAFLAASATTYMRALIAAGLSPDDATGSLLFALAVGADTPVEIAKLRAARRIWARIAESFGCSPEARPMALQAVSSRRMLAKRDPWVNMLRGTAACFAAGAGGADIITIRPFTDAMGLPSKLARRIARNTQIIAQEESNLGKVADPAGGAWAMSSLADELAEVAWETFQAIEAAGGVAAALINGVVQSDVFQVRANRQRDVARRKLPVTGVSDFPQLDEIQAEIVDADLNAILAAAAQLTGTKPADRSWTSLSAAAKTATLADLIDDGVQDMCDPLWPTRLAEPFERLRDAAEAYADKRGAPPKVFLATLGPLAEHTARTSFATNFFAAGGVSATVGALEDFAASGAVIACICGSDKRYVDEAPAAAKTLKSANAGRVYLAGKPGDNEANWKDAGVDEFIHVGVDVVSSLELAHAELGLTLA